MDTRLKEAGRSSKSEAEDDDEDEEVDADIAEETSKVGASVASCD